MIKVGDKVLFDNGASPSSYEILTVIRETKTQWVTDDEQHFRKTDGYMVGRGYWYYPKIMELTPENLDRYNKWKTEQQHKSLWSSITNLSRPTYLSIERLREIYAELKGEGGEK